MGEVGGVMGCSIGIKIVFILVNKWVDDVPKFRRGRKTGVKVSVNLLGVATEYDRIFDAASDDGLGKEDEVLKRRCRVACAVREGVIKDTAIRREHTRDRVVKGGDFREKLKLFDGVECIRGGSMEMVVAVQPERVYGSPKFRGKLLKEAGGLVLFVVWLVGESQVLVLERDPVGCEVAVEKMIPANALLGTKERKVLVREHLGRFVEVSRVGEKEKYMVDQGVQRGI